MQVSGYKEFWLGFLLMVILSLPLILLLGILARINLKFRKNETKKVVIPVGVVVDPVCNDQFALSGNCNSCPVYDLCVTSLVLEKLEALK